MARAEIIPRKLNAQGGERAHFSHRHGYVAPHDWVSMGILGTIYDYSTHRTALTRGAPGLPEKHARSSHAIRTHSAR